MPITGLIRSAMQEPVRSGNAAFIGVVDPHGLSNWQSGLETAPDQRSQAPQATPKATDTSQYTLFNPTPADKMRDFNTDRPTKSNVPYTVPAGHFQYEGDLFIYGYDNISTPDTNITSWTVGNPTFKLGLLNNLDFEVNISFYNSIRSATVSTGASTIAQGFGDTFTRFKWNLFGNDGGGPALALIPYAKWPTAPMAPQGVGNGYIEGGLIAPFAVPLPAASRPS